jgi:EpsD family peptidyl-prolyl cis-trans isomerase
MMFRVFTGTAVAFSISLLAACGGNKTEAPKATQVVAKVNDVELSVHQLNFYLQGVGNVPSDKLPQVRKDVLGRLVEQESIVQEALLKKLDREPLVQQQLEAARRDVLVKAHLQKIATSVGTPDQASIDKFFQERPALFEKRRVYKFAEIVLPGRPVNWVEIEKLLLPTRTINEASEVLKSKGIELPVAQNITRGSEELPIEQVEKFAGLKEGEVVIYQRPPGIVVAQILSSKEAPVDVTRAKPVIERFLLNKARSEAVQGEMKRIKDAVKVTYLGEFAAGAEPPKAATPAGPPTPAKATAADDAKSMENGLKGLK